MQLKKLTRIKKVILLTIDANASIKIIAKAISIFSNYKSEAIVLHHLFGKGLNPPATNSKKISL